jgi:hypothetical protein
MLLVEEKASEKEPKEFRYGVPPEMYSEWREVQKRIGLPQTQILHRLVRFLLDQNEITQGMILGTLTPRPDLIEFALKRAKPHRPGVFATLAATTKTGPKKD